MTYNFVENNNFKQPDDSGTFSDSNGGTEFMLRKLRSVIDSELLDKFHIICSRVRNIDDTKIPILWLHDMWNDPENETIRDPKIQAKFKKFVFVSNFQFNSYNIVHGITHNQSVVIKNAIEPIQNVQKSKDEIRLIYHTTPHRGLELLVPAFDSLSKIIENIHLDVFSSFKAYNWPERDQPYEKLFKFCEDHPKITYHGYQPNDVVREYLAKSHIFAYPSIWPETSCISAIEALSAGCAIVCPDFAALPETTLDFGFQYRFNEDPQKHVQVFANKLHAVINNIHSNEMQKHLEFQKIKADHYYSWEIRKIEWEKFLKSLLN